jgi:hypothetical protein
MNRSRGVCGLTNPYAVQLSDSSDYRTSWYRFALVRLARSSVVDGYAQTTTLCARGTHKNIVRCDTSLMHLLASAQEVISAIFQWLLMLAAATSPIVLNVWAWIRLRRSPVPDTGATWQRRLACLGLASSSLAYALPLTALIRNSTLMNSGHPVDGKDLVSWRLVQNIMTASVVLSLILAVFSPKYVRIQLFVSPLIPFLFWISVPVGVL